MNLERRMAAEGLPSIDKIADMIVSEGEKMKTHGRIKVGGRTRYSHGSVANTYIHEAATYNGGYMYTNWHANLDSVAIKPRWNHWLRSWDDGIAELEYFKYFSDLLKDAPKGAILTVGYRREHESYIKYQKVTGQWWKVIEEFDGVLAASESRGVYLPPKIRFNVANMLGLEEMTSTFHRAFDAAIKKLEGR